jgi:hypothetical protein
MRWDEQRRQQATEAAAHQPAGDDDFDRLCAAALGGPAGREFMKALRDRYIERPDNPLAPEHMLRVRATQQQFVRDLERARDRGLAAPAAKPKAP